MRVTRNPVVVLAAALATLYSGACSDDDDRMSPTAPSPIAASPQAGDAYARGAWTGDQTESEAWDTELVSAADYTGATPPAHPTTEDIGDAIDTAGLEESGIDPALLRWPMAARNRESEGIRSATPGLTRPSRPTIERVEYEWQSGDAGLVFNIWTRIPDDVSRSNGFLWIHIQTRRGETVFNDDIRIRPESHPRMTNGVQRESPILGRSAATGWYIIHLGVSNCDPDDETRCAVSRGVYETIEVVAPAVNPEDEPEEPEPETMQPPSIEWVAVYDWSWAFGNALCVAHFVVQLDESTLTEGTGRRASSRRKGDTVFSAGTRWTTASRLTQHFAGATQEPGEIEFIARQRKDGVVTEAGPVFSKYIAADPSDDCGRRPGGVRNLTVTWEDDTHVTVRWKEPRNVRNGVGGLPVTKYELGDVTPGNCPDSRFPFREVRVTDDSRAAEETYEHRLRIGGANTIEAIGVRAVNVKGHGSCVTATVDGQGGTEPSAPTWTARGRTWTCNAPDAPRCRADQQVRVSTGLEGRKEVQVRYARQGSAAQESDWTEGTGTEIDTAISLLPVEYTVQARYRTGTGTSPWSDARRLHGAPGPGDRFSTELQNRPLPGPRNLAAVKTGGRWTLTWRTPSGAGLPITGYDYGFVRNAPGTNRQPCSFVRRNKATFAPHWNDGGFSGTVDDPGNEYRYIGVEAVDFMEGGECARIEIEREVRDPDPVPGTPFTAELDGPARHQGADFEVRLTFSTSNLSLSYSTIRDDALEVSGGKVESARRAQSGSDQGWIVRVNPDNGHSAVDITLPVRECSETGAICTRSGEKLSAPATRTVQP